LCRDAPADQRDLFSQADCDALKTVSHGELLNEFPVKNPQAFAVAEVIADLK
jgi:hypothetical protein